MPRTLAETYEALRRRGVEYLAFLSFARDRPPKELVRQAERVKEALEQELGYFVDRPAGKGLVFFDDEALKGGDYIDGNLGCSLCKSVCVVAVCAPVYFDRSYCGREWAAMEQLGARRFPNAPRKPIVPVLLRKPDPLPPVFVGERAIKYYDISQDSVARNYFKGAKFGDLIRNAIVPRVKEFAEALVDSDAGCDCNDFKLPASTAFAGYSLNAAPFPLRG
jgi:hypothetical protein